jgi:hypothetical protein
MADNGSNTGLGLIAGILLVVLVGVGIFLATDGFNFKGNKDVNINIDVPKVDTPAKPGG